MKILVISIYEQTGIGPTSLFRYIRTTIREKQETLNHYSLLKETERPTTSLPAGAPPPTSRCCTSYRRAVGSKHAGALQQTLSYVTMETPLLLGGEI